MRSRSEAIPTCFLRFQGSQQHAGRPPTGPCARLVVCVMPVSSGHRGRTADRSEKGDALYTSEHGAREPARSCR